MAKEIKTDGTNTNLMITGISIKLDNDIKRNTVAVDEMGFTYFEVEGAK